MKIEMIAKNKINSRLAVISFVLSVLGLIITLLIGKGLGLFTSLIFGALFYPLYPLFILVVPILELIGFVTSIKSIRQIKRNRLKGMSLAIMALIISSLFIIFFIILLVFFILLMICGNACAPIL